MNGNILVAFYKAVLFKPQPKTFVRNSKTTLKVKLA